MASAKRDENRIPTLLAVTDDGNLTPTRLLVDPTTKRLKVSAVITSGGGITSLNSLTSGSQDFAAGSSGSDFNISSGTIASGGRHTLNLPSASSVNRGLLTAANWSSFNAKLGTANILGTTDEIEISYSGSDTTIGIPSSLQLGSVTMGTLTGGAIGKNVQAWDAQLDDIASLGVTDGNFIVADGVNWVAESGATARNSLSLGTTDDVTFGTVTAKINTGTISGAAIGKNVQAFSARLTDIAALAVTDGNIQVADGTTWIAESGATARTSLGLAIGSNVQAWDAQLDDIAGLGVTDGNFIVADGVNWVAESGATARTSIGLGTTANVTFGSLVVNNLSIGSVAYYDTEFNIGNGGTDLTANWNNGNKQKVILTAVGSAAFTDPPGAANLVLRLIQADGTLRTVEWPTSVKWPGGTAPTLTTGTDKIDIVSFYFTGGTLYYGQSGANFS